jgi:hypothetical protein
MRQIVLAFLSLGLAFPATAADLTLKRVMLSSGGIGYFEYAAEVEGDATLGLDVPLDQVDDVLKSLVVFDASGGVAGVELPGKDNTIAAFGDLPFGPEALKSPTDYLNALRGTEVTVQGPRPMTGRIMQVEAATKTTDQATVQTSRVTLLTAEGLRQFVLEDADAVQVADPVLRGRIEQAMEALRREAGRTARHLTIRVKGEGKRSVAVGYVAGAPLWKATYRLMLPETGSPKARLQGWATLENQSGADWKGVSLTLQYGNPVSFRQALYRSYFVQRPEVPVEILGHVMPDVDTEARPAEPAGAAMKAPALRGIMAPALATGSLMSPPPPPAPSPAPASIPMAAPAQTATADESAEETTFTLAQPVDLQAGHSETLPIVDKDVPAERVDLAPYGQAHPFSAIRVHNDTGLSLPAGVLTLYESRAAVGFVGDARLGGLPAGQVRLLSFAQDLRTTVDTTQTTAPSVVSSFSVADGVLTYVQRFRQVFRISMTAPANEARSMLLAIPKSNGNQTLTIAQGTAKAEETTESAWRIAVSLKPGETQSVTVYLDQPTRQTTALLAGDDQILQLIVGNDSLDQAGRAALRHLIDLRRDEARKRAEIDSLNKTLEAVQSDEDRLRQNLAAVSAGDALRSRLTKALDADETRIDQLHGAIADATSAAEKAHKALADAIAALHI